MQPKIKFCGMTRHEDIELAFKLGVDAIGLIFYDKSPRSITIEQARLLLQKKPLFLSVVAVMVNPNPDFVFNLLETLPIDYLQFHGNESASFCEQFNFPYLKAVPAVSNKEIIEATHMYRSAAALILDTPTELFGGSGVAFDWSIIPEIKTPFVIAGGINDNNIEKLLVQCQPYAIDICSGIEREPGIKDALKMRLLMNKIKYLQDNNELSNDAI